MVASQWDRGRRRPTLARGRIRECTRHKKALIGFSAYPEGKSGANRLNMAIPDPLRIKVFPSDADQFVASEFRWQQREGFPARRIHSIELLMNPLSMRLSNVCSSSLALATSWNEITPTGVLSSTTGI